jgi:hypothetical protein
MMPTRRDRLWIFTFVEKISAGIVKLDKGTNNVEFESYWDIHFLII